MNKVIEIDSEHRLEYRETPWDTIAFGFPTNEILNIYYSEPILLKQLLTQFEKKSRKNGVRFSYCRINANDIALKNALQKSGYYYAETSAFIYKHDVHREEFSAIFRNDLPLSMPQSELEFQQLQVIAQNAFHHSRFHEDPFIDPALAKKRYYNWINDLRAQECSFLTYSSHGTIQAFIAFVQKKKSVKLILGGSDEGKGFIAPFFLVIFPNGIPKSGYPPCQRCHLSSEYWCIQPILPP
jgi:hypothetical protein